MMRPDEGLPIPPPRNVPLPAVEPPPASPAITYGAPLPPLDQSHWRFVFEDDPDEEDNEEEQDDARPHEGSSD